MIVAILTILAATGASVQMRSIDSFETLAACEVFLVEDAPNRTVFQRALSARLGMAVAVDAECVQIIPGVPA